jgi:hypothetical protein
MPYRSLLVRMYYTTVAKKYTPDPFAEFRVYVLSDRKIDSSVLRLLEFELEYLEFLFVYMPPAVIKGAVFTEYEGREGTQWSSTLQRNVKWKISGTEDSIWVDKDEAVLDLERTGLAEPMLGDIYRYVYFVQSMKDYHEVMIRDIERTRNPEWIMGRFGFRSYLEEKRRIGILNEPDFLLYTSSQFMARIPERLR